MDELVTLENGRAFPVVMEDRDGRPTGRATRRFVSGPQEPGVYSFWTVMVGKEPLCTVRTITGRTVENRLREYASLTPAVIRLMESAADRVLPALDAEIDNWLETHPGDKDGLERATPQSLRIERGTLYHGAECKHCERMLAISVASGANAPFAQAGIVRCICRGCGNEGEYQAREIRSFVG